ncbi:hypothetical protein CYY_001951 [Polysphondylium violaceum]|uniref:Sulphur transport domain-containing protein n=1 Tax=Polysphondylium violaceum TaxID=133409 RepID=A0A8J4Q119_9MYCE|nr:hypothetical protein CYY_001951 [Polysphondylium violaceum]
MAPTTQNTVTIPVEPSTKSKILSGVSGAIIGTVFGYALQRSKVYLPLTIMGQMEFTNFTMLKMFMSASLTSSLAITFLDSNKLVKVDHLPMTLKRNIIGGAIMGYGIYATGACPGTVLAQVGAGVPGTLYTLLGGIAGSVLYGLVDKYITKMFPAKLSGEKTTLYQKLNVPLKYVTIPFALMLIGVLSAIESLVPWQTNSGVSSNISIFGSFSNNVWSPYAAGLVIGLLQIPSYLLIGNGLGTSSAYVSVFSRICNTFTGSCNLGGASYFSRFGAGVRSISGPLLNLGIIFGAYLSSQSSPLLNPGPSSSPLSHFLGGAILLFGARFANGCTSGHGLTAMAKMELGSFAAVASMFGSGMLTAYFLRK